MWVLRVPAHEHLRPEDVANFDVRLRPSARDDSPGIGEDPVLVRELRGFEQRHGQVPEASGADDGAQVRRDRLARLALAPLVRVGRVRPVDQIVESGVRQLLESAGADVDDGRIARHRDHLIRRETVACHERY